MSGAPALRDLDVACGIVLGAPRWPARLPAAPGDGVVAALEAVIRPALRRGPCLVSFSGGRDSSAVLAVAARLARREGLPAPIPATNRFRDAPATDEDAWQERVARHLGLDDWVRLTHDDELDALGPVATGVLRRHGVLWPFNAHFHAPLLQAARGGTLLTGIGGDELFRSPARPEIQGRRALVRHVAPAPVRRRLLERRGPAAFPWLSDAGRRAAARAAAAHDAPEPRTVRRRMAWTLGQRYMGVNRDGLALIAGDAGAAILHPLSVPSVWAEVARVAPARFYADRTAAMRALFGELLPDDVLARESKATFNEAFWRDASSDFARSWEGGGVPAGLVDAEALKAHWRGERPWAQSFTLLQAAWLSAAGQPGQELADARERVGALRALQQPDRA